MFANVDIEKQLQHIREKVRNNGDVIPEANRILKKELFSEKNVLGHLKHYENLSKKLEEEDLPEGSVFRLEEIRTLAVHYRLKFLESGYYRPELPYEIPLKIEELNRKFHKDLQGFYILARGKNFNRAVQDGPSLFFARTNYDNYCLLHAWGKRISWYRKFKVLPLRNFEALVLTVVAVTLVITLLLPTGLITLDNKAAYWSGYRAAAFFHLLIFNSGVTVYFTFAFAKNFSSTIWNRYKDFD